jgi:hypothetical protein
VSSLIPLLLVGVAVMAVFVIGTILVFAALMRSSQLSQAQELINGSWLEPESRAQMNPTQVPAPQSEPRFAPRRAAFSPKG